MIRHSRELDRVQDGELPTEGGKLELWKGTVIFREESEELQRRVSTY